MRRQIFQHDEEVFGSDHVNMPASFEEEEVDASGL